MAADKQRRKDMDAVEAAELIKVRDVLQQQHIQQSMQQLHHKTLQQQLRDDREYEQV